MPYITPLHHERRLSKCWQHRIDIASRTHVWELRLRILGYIHAFVWCLLLCYSIVALLYCVFPIADRRLWALGFGLPHRLPSKGCLQKLAPNEDFTSGSNVKITNNRQYQRSDLGPIKMPFECISLLDTKTRESKKEFPCHSECWLRGFLKSPTIGLVVKMVKPTNEASTYRHWLRLSFSILRMSQCLTLNLHILGGFDLWLERELQFHSRLFNFLARVSTDKHLMRWMSKQEQQQRRLTCKHVGFQQRVWRHIDFVFKGTTWELGCWGCWAFGGRVGAVARYNKYHWVLWVFSRYLSNKGIVRLLF